MDLRRGAKFGNQISENRIIISDEYFWRLQMKSFLLTLAIAFLVIPVFSIIPATEVQARSGDDALKALPQLQLKDFAGKPVKQADLGGKAYIVDFWATWCGPCIVEIPAFNRLQERYADKGLKVVGVTLASGEANEVQAAMKELVTKKNISMKYTVVMGDDNQLGDLNVMGFPTTFVVTRDCKIYKRYTGAGPKKVEEIEADIQKLLQEQ
jgi:thiol-disulfide isomerase/thioredoxin